jgi:Domain of unknown function (DUF1330)
MTRKNCEGIAMVAYVIFIKEKTKKQAEIELYKQMAPAGMAGHPITFRIAHGRKEVVEGPDCEDMMMLEFPTLTRQKHGTTVQPTKPQASIASRVQTIAPSSLKACRQVRRVPKSQTVTVPENSN